MNNYTKGKVNEEPIDRESIPIPNLPKDFLWMQVKSGSKMQRLTDHAISILKNDQSRAVVWTGSGDGVVRVVACAESLKRSYKMHQITKITSRKCEELWEPKIEGLDPLVVNREIPVMHILMSLDPLDVNEPGYQAPDGERAFWKADASERRDPKRKKKPAVSSEEIAAMGLQSNNNRNKRSFSGKKTRSQTAN